MPTNQFIHLSISSNHDTKINMELTPSPAAAVSSLLSHYQLQQFHASRNNDDQNGRNHTIHHNLGNNSSFLLKDKDKTHHATNSREGSSPNLFPAGNRSYPSTTIQSDNNHENHPTQNLHHLDQNQLHGQLNIPEAHGVSTLQSNETSKFFMSSLLNLSSGSAQTSTESSLQYQGTGKFTFQYIEV